MDIFKDVAIDEEENDNYLRQGANVHDENAMPKGVVSLEKHFDL